MHKADARVIPVSDVVKDGRRLDVFLDEIIQSIPVVDNGLTMGSPSAINGSPGTDRLLNFQSDLVNRWGIAANSNPENFVSGVTGSDFVIYRYNDNGGFMDVPLAITRIDGHVTLNGGALTVKGTGAVSTIVIDGPGTTTSRNLNYTSSGVNQWSLQVSSGGPADFLIRRFSDTGVPIDYPLTINRATGLVTIQNALAVTGALNVNGGMTIAGGLSVSSVFYIQSASGQTAQVLNGPPATPKVIYLQTNANSRWHITSDGVAEGGGNSGSNFAIARYTDAGGIIDVPFYIQRSTGLVNIITNLQVNGAMTATSGTFTNVLVNPLNNQSGITLTRFTDTSPLGNFLFGQIAAGGTTLFAVDVNGQGYFKNAILYGGGLLSGSPVGYAGAPVVAVKPFANGGDTFYGQRFTDTAPAGYFLRLRNAANTADLFYVDLGGFLSTANGINAAGGINTSGWLSGSGNIQALPPSNGGLYVCWNRTNGAGESAIFNTYINTPAAQPSFNFFQMTSPTTTALIGSLAQAGATFASLTVGTGATLNTTVGSGAIAARQMVNGGDTIVCQRATDAASTGQFIRFIDAANLNTIFQVGMSGDTLSLGNIKGNTLQTSQFTVANLAGIPNVQTGHRAFVTDCNTAVFNAPVAAGGSNKVPVFYNGTGWMVG